MDADRSLTVRVERRGDKYTWELHRDGRFHPVKFSAPVYASEVPGSTLTVRPMTFLGTAGGNS
jgi:hypothetical protein